jgi:exopolyphosphatase/guanosine-5'-triphosphate,3'-diphosphate pyrophosphatase
VKIHLLRHAQAWKRSRWGAADHLRPLSRTGRRQAAAIARRLGKEKVVRIVSSPALRCLQSVAPLAAARELEVEIDPCLAEGEKAETALELIESLGDRSSVVCTQGNLIPEMLVELELRGLRIKGRMRCEKGSVWTLEGPKLSSARARYKAPTRRGRRSEETVRMAVLDLGSTSFHLVVAEVDGAGGIRRIARERVMLRLGGELMAGVLSPELVERSVHAARRLATIAREYGAEPVLAVATAAFRDAEGGPQLAAAIQQVTEAPVRILTGEEEARLILAAFHQRGDLVPGVNLGLDLGGGSLELALGDGAAVLWETTLPLGTVRLQREWIHSDPPTEAERSQLCDRIQGALAPHAERIRKAGPSGCAATGGSVRAMAYLIARRRGLGADFPINRMFLTRKEVSALAGELASSTHEHRLAMPGMKRERADLLPAGALVVACLLAELELVGPARGSHPRGPGSRLEPPTRRTRAALGRGSLGPPRYPGSPWACDPSAWRSKAGRSPSPCRGPTTRAPSRAWSSCPRSSDRRPTCSRRCRSSPTLPSPSWPTRSGAWAEASCPTTTTMARSGACRASTATAASRTCAP